jgi:hypothetical protein
MRIITPIIISFLSLTTFSQSLTFQYFDDNWKPTKPKKVVFRRKIEKQNDTLYKVQEDFYDQIIMTGQYSSIDPFIENGHFDFTSFNKKIIVKGQYKNGEMVGDWFFYNKKKLVNKINYDLNFSNIVMVDTLFQDEYSDKTKQSSKNNIEFSEKASNYIIYPPMANNRLIGEKVITEFYVDSNNMISKIFIDSRADKDLKTEVLRILVNILEWEPELINTLSPDTFYRFPINFKMK